VHSRNVSNRNGKRFDRHKYQRIDKCKQWS